MLSGFKSAWITSMPCHDYIMCICPPIHPYITLPITEHLLIKQREMYPRVIPYVPPVFFFPGLVHPIPAGEAGRGHRGNNDDDDDDNMMLCLMGPVPSIAARELPLIRSGNPLSLTYTPRCADKREGGGIYTENIRKIYLHNT